MLASGSDKTSPLLASPNARQSISHNPSRSVLTRIQAHSDRLILPLLLALLLCLVLILSLAVLLISQPTATPLPSLTANTDRSLLPAQTAPANLSALITAEAVYTHLQGLQRAADVGNASRRTGTAGYNASVEYVSRVLSGLPSLRWRLQPWTTGAVRGVNVIADTRTGDPRNTITVGAHLDAVYSGLNDDGSGSTAVLALAVAVDALVQSKQLMLTNRIRFHWYDAEESGLLGSRAAVALLLNGTDEGERLGDMVAQLNADMLGSPNWIMGILDGRNLPPTAGNSSRAGSAVLVDMFVREFAMRGYVYRWITSLSYMRGSDQWSYWAQGVPAAILFSGVSEVHSAEDVRDFGGVAGIAADPCTSSRRTQATVDVQLTRSGCS